MSNFTDFIHYKNKPIPNLNRMKSAPAIAMVIILLALSATIYFRLTSPIHRKTCPDITVDGVKSKAIAPEGDCVYIIEPHTDLVIITIPTKYK